MEENKCGVTRENLEEKMNAFPMKECSGCDNFSSDDFGTYTCKRINALSIIKNVRGE